MHKIDKIRFDEAGSAVAGEAAGSQNVQAFAEIIGDVLRSGKSIEFRIEPDGLKRRTASEYAPDKYTHDK